MICLKDNAIIEGSLELETTEKCPSCGEEMETGFIVSQRTISWCDQVPKVICYCGEILSKKYSICAWVSGYRCKRCKIIRYQEVEQAPNKDTNDWPVS
ncbi:MAG: PF20097 family protein [Candidatus Thorarchaeota archaeon]